MHQASVWEAEQKLTVCTLVTLKHSKVISARVCTLSYTSVGLGVLLRCPLSVHTRGQKDNMNASSIWLMFSNRIEAGLKRNKSKCRISPEATGQVWIVAKVVCTQLHKPAAETQCECRLNSCACKVLKYSAREMTQVIPCMASKKGQCPTERLTFTCCYICNILRFQGSNLRSREWPLMLSWDGPWRQIDKVF